MKFTAVQMIGTQRSGSNLLRLMLNQLPDVSAPHPPHIIERFMSLLPLYENLNQADNFRRLATDVCDLISYNPVAWTGVKLNVDELVYQCNYYSLMELTRVIYEHKAKHDNARIWICKSMANIHYVGELETSLQPLYIFLYRDGRDVACSFRKAVVGEKHTYFIAKQWKEEQDKCMALQEYLRGERFVAVCYEELLANPEQELRKICAFIGTDYSSDCLQYHRSGEAVNTASSGVMWQNVSQGVLTKNRNKYFTEMPADDIVLFERVAGNTLQKLGYPLHVTNSKYNPLFSASELKEYAILNAQLKFAAKLKQTPEDAARRKQQDALLSKLQAKMNENNTQQKRGNLIAV